MQKFYSLSKFLGLVLLVLSVSACRKKIDFTEVDRTKEGALSPNVSFNKPWITVPTPGITDITLIEQDYNGIYFTGVQSGFRRLYYFEGENTPSTVWVGNSVLSSYGEFTTLVFNAPKMYVGHDGGSLANFRIFSSPTSVAYYNLNLNGKKVTDVKSIGNEMYLSGDFTTLGVGFPSTDYFDKINIVTGYVLGMGGLESPAEAQCYGWFGFFACGKNMHSGRSIANWDGSGWIPYSTLTERVTDVEMLGDTLMIAGNLPNGKAIMKEKNGFETPFNELINTAPNEAETNIKFLRSGQVIYAYGTVNFENYTFFSVLQYKEGSWSYVGKLNETPTDLAILDGYLYAATASGIKKIQI